MKREVLNAEHVWPARCIENDSFRVEDTRIETFTEEVLNWKLPEHHNVESKKSLAVLNDDSVHVFTSSPLLLESYEGIKDARNRVHRTWDLRKFGSRFVTSSTSFSPQIVSLNDRVALLINSNSVLLFDPTAKSKNNEWISVSVTDELFDEQNEDMRSNVEKKTSMFNSLFSLTNENHRVQEDLRMYDTLSTENLLIIGNLKQGSFACLNFETMEQHTVQVNKSIVSCSLLSENTWIVQDDCSNSYVFI